MTANAFLRTFAEALKNLILIVVGAHLALSIEAQRYGFWFWFYGFIGIGMFIVFSFIEGTYQK